MASWRRPGLPRIFQNHSEFTRESNWLGFYSLRRLTERLMELNDKLTIEEGDPWRVSVDKSEASDEMDASNRDLQAADFAAGLTVGCQLRHARGHGAGCPYRPQ